MFPPENMELVNLNSLTEPNLIANPIVIVENEDDLDHLIVPLCADAIEIKCQVLKSKGSARLRNFKFLPNCKKKMCCVSAIELPMKTNKPK
jgi:hypothetical protein